MMRGYAEGCKGMLGDAKRCRDAGLFCMGPFVWAHTALNNHNHFSNREIFLIVSIFNLLMKQRVCMEPGA